MAGKGPSPGGLNRAMRGVPSPASGDGAAGNERSGACAAEDRNSPAGGMSSARQVPTQQASIAVSIHRIMAGILGSVVTSHGV